MAGDIEEKAVADRVGARSTVSLLQQRLRLGAPEAKRRLALAAAFHPAAALTGQTIAPAWPATAEAFREGRISGDHARVLLQNLGIIAEKIESSPDAGDSLDPTEAEAHLLQQALGYDPSFVERCGKRWIDHLDPDGSLPSGAESARDHGLFIGRPTRSGLVPFRGAMTQEQHETLLTAIQPATNPRHGGERGWGGRERAGIGTEGEARPQGHGPGDDHDPGGAAGRDDVGTGRGGADGAERDLDSRTHQRKLLDGLIGVCAAALDNGEVRAHGGRAAVLVTIDHRTLLGQLNGSAAFAHTGPVSPSVARRLACDAGIIPVVLGGEGQILELFTAPQRKSIIARDRGCVFPGCTAPPSWCACHHIEYYSRGDPTSVENGCLLCEHHHAVIHRGGWEIVIRGGRPGLIPPWWVDPRQRPRRNHFHHPPGPAHPDTGERWRAPAPRGGEAAP